MSDARATLSDPFDMPFDEWLNWFVAVSFTGKLNEEEPCAEAGDPCPFVSAEPTGWRPSSSLSYLDNHREKRQT